MTPKELHGQKSHTSMGPSSQSAPLMLSVHPAGNSSVWESGFYFFLYCWGRVLNRGLVSTSVSALSSFRREGCDSGGTRSTIQGTG